jgi:hypothetical protein
LASSNPLDAPSLFYSAPEPTALYDAALNRVWYIAQQLEGATWLPYLDLADNTYKRSTAFSPASGLSGPVGGMAQYPHSLLHDDGTRRCILWFTGYPNYPSATARVLDLNNIGAGWRSVTISGSLSQFNSSPAGQSLTVQWARFPDDNCHYTFDGNSSVFSKITPPASGVTGTWTISTLTALGPAIPKAKNGGGGADNANLPHYSRFFYVPALGSFAWIAGGTEQVALWKPA